MRLDLGNVQIIQNPSADELRHYLRFMPAEAPFIILEAAQEYFLQATCEWGGYYVEYRENGRAFCATMKYEDAAIAFELFRIGDESFKTAIPWSRKIDFDNRYTRGGLVLVIAGMIAFLIWKLVEFFR